MQTQRLYRSRSVIETAQSTWCGVQLHWPISCRFENTVAYPHPKHRLQNLLDVKPQEQGRGFVPRRLALHTYLPFLRICQHYSAHCWYLCLPSPSLVVAARHGPRQCLANNGCSRSNKRKFSIKLCKLSCSGMING